MPSPDEPSTTGAHETGLWTSLTMVLLAVFFIGCGCFTFAEILLGSNDRLSAILAIVGTPLVIVTGILLVLRSRLGAPPGPDERRTKTRYSQV